MRFAGTCHEQTVITINEQSQLSDIDAIRGVHGEVVGDLKCALP